MDACYKNWEVDGKNNIKSLMIKKNEEETKKLFPTDASRW